MKCSTHNEEATGICVHCGRAVCPSCPPVTSSPRVACSEACAQALAKADRAIDTILGRSTQASKVNAYFLLLSGVILLLFALYAQVRYPQLKLVPLFAGVMGVAFLVGGVWYYRAAGKGGSQ